MTSLIARIKAAYNHHKQYRSTVNELARLTDRELQDLGISRFDIPRIAREAYSA